MDVEKERLKLTPRLQRFVSYYNTGLTPLEICKALNISKQEFEEIKHSSEIKDLLNSDAHSKRTIDEDLSVRRQAVEMHLLSKMTELIPSSDSLRDVTNALKVIVDQQVPRNPAHPSNQIYVAGNVVQLVIPAHAAPELVLNERREVIAVGDKQIAPMAAESVLKMFRPEEAPQKSLSKDKENNHEPARIFNGPSSLDSETVGQVIQHEPR